MALCDNRVNLMHTERHKAGYAYQARFPDLAEFAAYEGGAVFLAGQSSPYYVILDESTLADFMDEEDELIVIHTFNSPAERDTWLRENLPRSKSG